jgi:hypothetical protein
MIPYVSTLPQRRIYTSPHKVPSSLKTSENDQIREKIADTNSNRSSYALATNKAQFVTFVKENKRMQESTDCKSNSPSEFKYNSENNTSILFPRSKAVQSFKKFKLFKETSEPTTIQIRLDKIFHNLDEKENHPKNDLTNNEIKRENCIPSDGKFFSKTIFNRKVNKDETPQDCHLDKTFILSSLTKSEGVSLNFSHFSSINSFESDENLISSNSDFRILGKNCESNSKKKLNHYLTPFIHNPKENKRPRCVENSNNMYNHRDLPKGKENNEKFKIALINNKLKKEEIPVFNSDFGKKRCYRELCMLNNLLFLYR